MMRDIFYESHTCVWSQVQSSIASALDTQINHQVGYAPRYKAFVGLRRQIFDEKVWLETIDAVNVKHQIKEYFGKGTSL